MQVGAQLLLRYGMSYCMGPGGVGAVGGFAIQRLSVVGCCHKHNGVAPVPPGGDGGQL